MTQFVDMAYKGLKTPGSLNEYAVLEIEHILPDKPENDLRSLFTEANPNARYEDYKIKLGNLTLLEKPINIVAGNNFFSAKKDEYRNCRNYLTSSIAELKSVGQNTSINRINEKLRAFDEWSADSIEDRQELLIRLALDIWKTTPMSAE